jgi:MFS family permease
MITCRVLGGFFISPAFGIASGVVVELFWVHQRGQKMGVWTMFMTLGPPIGPLIGGFITVRVGTAWLFYVIAIVS